MTSRGMFFASALVYFVATALREYGYDVLASGLSVSGLIMLLAGGLVYSREKRAEKSV